ncbi:MAG: DUF3786 domain-containing protein [Spirochaetaceae bacterium]|jgi:hypothetical protein|nr:DUF3786 domain-containing protein [Spirochaetaceae bacterium]
MNHRLPQTEKKDWKEVPLEHYTELYAQLDPLAAAARCNIDYDTGEQKFSIRLMGAEYRLAFPEFKIETEVGADDTSISEKILLMRYLCEGRWTAPRGKQLSYREVPWGEVYFKSFEGRCLARFARTFGADPQSFNRVMEAAPLKAEKIPKNEFAYRFEFASNLSMSLFLWQADDEFPASAQILFDDNVPAAFSAEDIVVAGEVVITRLKALAAAL